MSGIAAKQESFRPKLGFLGGGWIGRHRLEAIVHSDVAEVAAVVDTSAVMGKPRIRAEIAGKYRVGDVRHCFADTSLARQVLGYEPRVRFHQGLTELAGWLEGQVATDRVAEARGELEARGLTV